MRRHQRILVILAFSVFLLARVGAARAVLRHDLLADLDPAWTLALARERELDAVATWDSFRGPLEATWSQQSPSGDRCAVWEATAQWQYGRQGVASCTRGGTAGRLARSAGNRSRMQELVDLALERG